MSTAYIASKGDRYSLRVDEHDVDERPVRGRRGRVKELATWLAQRATGHGEDWEDYLAQAEGEVSWDDFDAWFAKQGWRFFKAYRYESENGSVLYEAVRYNYAPLPKVKKFQLRHLDSENRWVHGAGPARVPYRLRDLISTRGERRPVVICEGEKDTDNAWSKGLRATCAQGSNWSDDVTDYLIGEDVIVVPDNDKKGHENAQKAVDQLSKVARSVKILELDGLPPRGDLTDWFAIDGNTADELIALASKVRPVIGGISASPVTLPDDTRTIPARAWLYPPFYIRQFVSVVTGTGGVGKSILAKVEAIAMTAGKDLLGVKPEGKLKVWYWNGEDPQVELVRRLAAAAKLHGVTKEDMGDRMFMDSGWTMPIVIATSDRRQGLVIDRATEKQIKSTILKNGIDVLIIDPFITAHKVNEGDNGEIEAVVNVLNTIAQETNCAIMIVHHTRKVSNGERTVDDARGASALINAARSVRVVNTMSTKEAEAAEVEERERRLHFRSDHGKVNLSRPPESADWFKLIEVDLENPAPGKDWHQGDKVGIVQAWRFPKVEQLRAGASDIRRALDLIRAGGPWRRDQRSKPEVWIGTPIARAMGIDLDSKPAKKMVNKMVFDWIRLGHLKSETRREENSRHEREYVVAGQVATVIDATVAGSVATVIDATVAENAPETAETLTF